MDSARVLIVEDNVVDALRLQDALGESTSTRFAVNHVETLSEVKACLQDEKFDVVVLDLGLPDSQGIGTFVEVKKLHPTVPIVVLSGLDDEALAIQAVREGAQDYLCKDLCNSHVVARSLVYAIERCRILNKLEESEARFRAIFEGSEDAIWIKDQSLRITHINPAMANVLGRPCHQVIGLRDSELFDNDCAKHFKEIDLRVLSGDSVQEERTVSIDGVKALWNIAKAPMGNSSGDIVGLCGIARDVTAWHRPQRQRQETLAGDEIPYPAKSTRLILESARIAAQKESLILLLGESGSGKDHLAKYIHKHSKNANGPYFSINCAAIAPELAESELFGHEKGAFTGAVGKKKGLLELAEGGTLLLNEIGDLSLPLQAKLLTFLDTKRFTRLGGEKEISVNARLLAATYRDLRQEIELGRFRHDLFYRIHVLSIEVPPLRKRLEDIPVLVREILTKMQGELLLHEVPVVDDAALEVLRGYDWPGNVRELRNVLERAVILTDGESIGVRHLRLQGHNRHSSGDDSAPDAPSLDGTLPECIGGLIRTKCVQVLKSTSGNKKLAASILGISRDTLYRYMKSLRINESEYT